MELEIPDDGLNMDDAKLEEVKNKFRQALPYFRLAMEEAKEKAGEGGKVGFGVIAVPKVGDGRITAQFDGAEFFEDLALLIGVGPSTEDEVLDAKAKRIVDMFGAGNIVSTPVKT
jgi:hypothetical protein